MLSDNPGNAAALNGLGISLKTMGYADEAVLTLQRAHEAAPDSADVLLNLASALALADRSEEAVAAYEAMLVEEPDNPEFHNYFNGYLGVIGHPDYLDSYRQALMRNPGDAGFAVPLARKLLLEAKGVEALDVLLKSMEAGGEAAGLNREISYVLREQGQFKQALEHAAAARDKEANPASERELATALMAVGADYEEALALLRSLVARFPEDQARSDQVCRMLEGLGLRLFTFPHPHMAGPLVPFVAEEGVHNVVAVASDLELRSCYGPAPSASRRCRPRTTATRRWRRG